MEDSKLTTLKIYGYYQQARSEANRVFEITKTFPKEEKFPLTDQIRRSARAVKSMIAEARGHRL